jgi:hypothetical protein
MNSLNQRITDLEGQEIKDRLPSFVHIESPYGNASIHSIKCKTNPHLIGDGYNLRLPDSFLVEITCSVNAKEQAIKGRIIFHLCELEKFIASTITLLYENSSK